MKRYIKSSEADSVMLLQTDKIEEDSYTNYLFNIVVMVKLSVIAAYLLMKITHTVNESTSTKIKEIKDLVLMLYTNLLICSVIL